MSLMLRCTFAESSGRSSSRRTCWRTWTILGTTDTIADAGATYDTPKQRFLAWDFADLELDGTNPDVVITADRDSNGFLLWEQASVAGTADYRNDYQFDGYGRPVTVTQDAVTGGNTVEKKRVEFSYNDDSLLAAIDRYLYETDGTTLDPVASSSFSYTGDELTGLVHSDPLEAILREYD